MTPHHELAVAIRHAVFDEVERNGLVSTSMERAIGDALILAAAKGGIPCGSSPALVAAARGIIESLHGSGPVFIAAIEQLKAALKLENPHGQA